MRNFIKHRKTVLRSKGQLPTFIFINEMISFVSLVQVHVLLVILQIKTLKQLSQETMTFHYSFRCWSLNVMNPWVRKLCVQLPVKLYLGEDNWKVFHWYRKIFLWIWINSRIPHMLMTQWLLATIHISKGRSETNMIHPTKGKGT
jgi:hypothetical protein